jgi:hypothetical protein
MGAIGRSAYRRHVGRPAVEEDARTVMAELGHSDPALSLRVYARSMRYGE